VRRQFKAARPGQLHVADSTYVQMVTGRFAHTAFVIDTFTGLIPGSILQRHLTGYVGSCRCVVRFAAPGQEEQAEYDDRMRVIKMSPGRRIQLIELPSAGQAHLQHL
jgi:hypothetical protein